MQPGEVRGGFQRRQAHAVSAEGGILGPTSMEQQAVPAYIYIYDDTEKFLDFVCQQTASEIDKGRRVVFCSNTLGLDAVLRAYTGQPGLPRLVYQEHLLYVSLKRFLDGGHLQKARDGTGVFQQANMFKESRETTIVDFGSFSGTGYTVQEIVEIQQQLEKKNMAIALCFDCRLLSPAELSYLLALVPNVYINNMRVTKQAADLVKIPKPMDVAAANGIVNSSLIDLIVRLASNPQQTDGSPGQLTNIVSELTMKRILSKPSLPSSPFSREDYDKDKEHGYLVSDQMAAEELKQTGTTPPLQQFVGGGMRRVQSKTVRHGSRIQLNFLEAGISQPVISEKSDEIVIRLDPGVFRK